MLDIFITPEKLEEICAITGGVKAQYRNSIKIFNDICPEGATLIDAMIKFTQSGKFNEACWLFSELNRYRKRNSGLFVANVQICKTCLEMNATAYNPEKPCLDYSEHFNCHSEGHPSALYNALLNNRKELLTTKIDQFF